MTKPIILSFAAALACGSATASDVSAPRETSEPQANAEGKAPAVLVETLVVDAGRALTDDLEIRWPASACANGLKTKGCIGVARAHVWSQLQKSAADGTVRVLSASKIKTLSGRRASLSWGSVSAPAESAAHPIGRFVLDVTPEVNDDASMALAVSLEGEKTPRPEQGTRAPREVHEVSLRPGEIIVLPFRAPLELDETARSLLVFISARPS